MQLISRTHPLVLAAAASLVAGCAGTQATTGIPNASVAASDATRLPLDVQYVTLNYTNKTKEALPTFLTGIRGDIMSGMYLASNGRQFGFIYHQSTQHFAALDYPGAYNTTPYGPSFEVNGSVRAVGSYTLPNEKADHGFFYDESQPKRQRFVAVDYPNATNTIPHSTYRDYVVGNWNELKRGGRDYEKYPVAGHGFIYNVKTQAYQVFDAPNAKSTTCYGIIDGAIAGGYTKPQGVHKVHAYVYDTSTKAFYTYDYPGAILTHFEGIAIHGRRGDYSLTGDWIGQNGTIHAFYVAMKNWQYQRPVEIAYQSWTTSGNSVFTQGGHTQVIGVYNTGGGTSGTNGYIASVP